MDRKMIYIPAVFLLVFCLTFFAAYEHIRSSTLEGGGPLVAEVATRAQPNRADLPGGRPNQTPRPQAAPAVATNSNQAANQPQALQTMASQPQTAASPRPVQPAPAQRPKVDIGYFKIKNVIDDLNERKGQEAGPKKDEKSIILTEGEINGYISERLRFKPAPGLRSLTISLGDGGAVSALANIDLDQVSSDSLSLRAFKGFFGSQQQLAIEGVFTASEGMGVFEVKRARLSGKYVPAFLVNEIIRQIGARKNPPIDVTRPFQLPLGIRSVQIWRGHVKLNL